MIIDSDISHLSDICEVCLILDSIEIHILFLFGEVTLAALLAGKIDVYIHSLLRKLIIIISRHCIIT